MPPGELVGYPADAPSRRSSVGGKPTGVLAVSLGGAGTNGMYSQKNLSRRNAG